MKTSSTMLVLSAAAAALVSCDRKPVTDPNANVKGRNFAPVPGISEIRVLAQNWSDADARNWYDTTQGSRMVPYGWFLKLEQANSETAFRDAANMARLGYVPRLPDKLSNPDGLPVGFVRDANHVGLTCAACHTGQINYKGKQWIIDGGQTMADAAGMLQELLASLEKTLADEAKFKRFAAAVGTADNEPSRISLRDEMTKVIAERKGYNTRNLPGHGQPGFGPGRIDAFGAIFNEVAVRFAQVADAPTKMDAPVSYPFLWDTPQHDRVQWNGSAANTESPLAEHITGTRKVGALGRNIGEVIGVFGDVDTTMKEIPFGGYAASVNKPNLITLEQILSQLWSPQWPEAEFGKIDTARAARGRALFAEHCVSCHLDINRMDPTRKVIAQMHDTGTDQTMAANAVSRKSRSGILEGRILLDDREGSPIPEPRKLEPIEQVSDLLSHVGQRVLIGSKTVPDDTPMPFGYTFHAVLTQGDEKMSVRLSQPKFANGRLATAKVVAHASLKKGKTPVFSPGADLDKIGGGMKLKFSRAADASHSTVQMIGGPGPEVTATFPYKARPLNGVWATAPYLHNGSVLNMDDLLKPASQRMTSFHLGSREFDPVKMGYVDAGDFTFDTTAQPGNSNAGHEYGSKVFIDTERAELIEYLKTL